jgi:hypothetical protein
MINILCRECDALADDILRELHHQSNVLLCLKEKSLPSMSIYIDMHVCCSLFFSFTRD